MKFFQFYYGLNCWVVWRTEFSRMVFFQRRGSIHGGVTTITSWTPKLAPLPSASSSTSFPWSLKLHRSLQKQKSSASSRTHAECYIFILLADQGICKVSLRILGKAMSQISWGQYEGKYTAFYGTGHTARRPSPPHSPKHPWIQRGEQKHRKRKHLLPETGQCLRKASRFYLRLCDVLDSSAQWHVTWYIYICPHLCISSISLFSILFFDIADQIKRMGQ